MALAGSSVAPEWLHSLTATALAALTRIVPVSPAGSPAGQPGATASPGEAPYSVNVCSGAQAPFAIDAKSRFALAAAYVGTTAVSTDTVVRPPDSTVVIPVPAESVFELRNARKSRPPAASQFPDVAVHVYTGTESDGKFVTLACARHPADAATAALWPMVSVPPELT